MGGEEAGDLVVEEGQAGGAEAQRVGGEVELAAFDGGFELGSAVVAIGSMVQICEPVDVQRRIPSELLAEVEECRLAAEVACLQELELALASVVGVGSRVQAFNRVDDQVGLREHRRI